MIDKSDKIASLSRQLNALQQSVSPEVWAQILQLEEQFIQLYDEAIESAYRKGLLDGLLKRTKKSSDNQSN